MNPDLMSLTPSPSDEANAPAESEKQFILDQFYGGIADYEKQIVRTAYMLEKGYQFAFAQNGNILELPNHFTINKSAVQDSPNSGANQITSLPKWIVSGQPYTSNLYIYCQNGDMFSRDVNGNYTKLFTAGNSQGNGLGQWLGYLYYTTNSSVGLYGPLGSPGAVNNDGFLGQGFNSYLVTQTGIAPINTQFSAVMVGHGNNLGKFDGTNWTANQLTLSTGTYIRSMDFVNQMLGIAVSTPGSLAPNPTLLYIWDAANFTFNAFVPADSPVDAILNWKNNLLYFANSTVYQGMSPQQSQQRLPKMTFYDSAVILPGAVTKYKGQAMFGVCGSTTSSGLQCGVYHWGNRNDNYPAAMNFDYTISTGNTTGVQIGALFGSGDQLFIGWGDSNTGTFGVDVVQPSNPYYSSAYVESLIIDDLRPVDDKNALTIRSSHLPLRSGESIQLAFKINRASAYTLSTTNTTVNSTTTSLRLPNNYTNFNELQCKFILGSQGATAPTFTSVGAAYMPLLTQSQY